MTREPEKKERPIAVNIGASLVVLLGIAWWVRGDPSALTPACLLYESGEGTCTFTNTTDEVGSGCGNVYFFCGKVENRGGERTQTLCSGEVLPGAAKVMEFRVEKYEELKSSHWDGACNFAWEPE